MAIDFPKELILDRILPLFEQERMLVRKGSPYRLIEYPPGRNETICSIDLLGMALWYLKNSGQQYRV